MFDKINTKPIILLILDGWGYHDQYHGNAIKQAYTPNMDFLWQNYPNSLLQASGKYVGLPSRQMGNSEVGHTTIGAGRIIHQELVKISQDIQSGRFIKNQTLLTAYNRINPKNNKVHIIGLCSNGGVHSHINHLTALLKISQYYTNIKTCLHLITDGRDSEPQNAYQFINTIEKQIKNKTHITICTISGRYYSMDRDCRWSRTEKAYRCLTRDDINKKIKKNIKQIIDENYAKKIYDEFLPPIRVNKGSIKDGDSIIFFNFRPDRMRQLVRSLCDQNFQEFTTQKFINLHAITFTEYDNSFKYPVVFKKKNLNNLLGQIISENKLKQFRLAETEKYAHVTYFFNGGQEEPFAGEDRIMVPSPKVNFYEKTPEMSIYRVTDELIKAIDKNIYSLYVINYANPDMIGHTGNFWATKKAIEITDEYVGKILQKVLRKNLTLIITADHGNAEGMLDINNKPCKSHTTNLVPFIMVNKDNIKNRNQILSKIGSIADIAPTILNLLEIEIPVEMDGKTLIKIPNFSCTS